MSYQPKQWVSDGMKLEQELTIYIVFDIVGHNSASSASSANSANSFSSANS